MFRTFLKNYFNDKYLKQLRSQILEYIPQNSKVIDIGCGTGSLLFELSSKIDYGLGIDTDSSMIKFVQKKLEREGLKNLEFKVQDANNFSYKKEYDLATLSLVVHSLDTLSGLSMLKRASSVADKVIIADYILLKGFKNFLVHMDEILAGHYMNFRKYEKNSIVTLIKESGLTLEEEVKTKYSEIGIWICSS